MSWSVADAKARLSEVLRLAREGRPQVIGAQNPCVVIALEEYQRIKAQAHPGLALVALGARLGGVEFELPARERARRVDMPDV